MNITVTYDAAVEVLKFIEDENFDPAVAGLRITVMPGGCSGFKYDLELASAPAEDDLIIEQTAFKDTPTNITELGFRIFVDPFSAPYVDGLTIKYFSTLQGSGFAFENPNATGGCGCGSSFSV